MKTIIIFTFYLQVLASSTSLFAKGNEAKNAPKAPQSYRVSVYQNTAKAINLIVLKEKSDNVKIRIKDANGNVVLRRNTKGIESFKQKFDFQKMEPGTYTIELKKDGELYSSEFHID